MNDVRTDLPVDGDLLLRDANRLLADVQALLKDVADGAGMEATEVRNKLGRRVQELRTRAGTLRHVSRDRVGQFAETADLYVREHPWQCLGMVAAIGATTGAIVALALGRR